MVLGTIGIIPVVYNLLQNRGRNPCGHSPEKLEEISRFRRNYMLIYLVVMASDWLQGPYIYVLYESYGFDIDTIAILFIAGFSSSMVFGSFIGSLSDTYGRKRMAMVFGVIYALSCLTKFINSFAILLFGRILSGIATSLLFSVFETWMVHEHHERGYGEEELAQTFSYATYGNGLIAIIMGVIASSIASLYGPASPHALAFIFLIVSTVLIYLTWCENYGDVRQSTVGSIKHASEVLMQKPGLILMGFIIALFEGAMYNFVFLWTPTLFEYYDEAELPLGMIFALFMICVMIGSNIFSWVVVYVIPELILIVLLIISIVALFLPSFPSSGPLVLGCFLLFELSVGLYFPTVGTLRGKYIPEEVRATVMNLFRIPLNLFVIVMLLNISSLGTSLAFFLCAALLFIAFLCALILYFVKDSSASTTIEY